MQSGGHLCLFTQVPPQDAQDFAAGISTLHGEFTFNEVSGPERQVFDQFIL